MMNNNTLAQLLAKRVVDQRNRTIEYEVDSILGMRLPNFLLRGTYQETAVDNGRWLSIYCGEHSNLQKKKSGEKLVQDIVQKQEDADSLRRREMGQRVKRIQNYRRKKITDMASYLIERESIRITMDEAQILIPYIDHLIMLSKRGDIHARQLARKKLNTDKSALKLFEILAPRYNERPHGFCRIIKAGFRKKDDLEMVIIELVNHDLDTEENTDAKQAKAKELDDAKRNL